MTVRLALVVSSDFSELGMAVGLARLPGAETRIYLPEKQRALAAAFPKQRLRLFQSTGELTSALAAFRPTHVALMSGYLLLDPEGAELAALLDACRGLASPSRLATTDPFLGLLQDPASCEAREFQSALARLPARLAPNATALREVPHLYPGPVDAFVGGAPRQGFRLLDTMPPRAVDKTWLFVLGELEAQRLLHELGSDLLLSALSARLEDAHRQGRHACIYAPAPLAAALNRDCGGRFPLDCRPHGEHSRFVAAVDAAEHAFYWNWSSHSIVRRLTAGSPVSFFGQGHVSALLPGVAERLAAGFYGGMQPLMLSMDSPLSIATVEDHHALQSAERQALAARYQALPMLGDVILG